MPARIVEKEFGETFGNGYPRRQKEERRSSLQQYPGRTTLRTALLARSFDQSWRCSGLYSARPEAHGGQPLGHVGRAASRGSEISGRQRGDGDALFALAARSKRASRRSGDELLLSAGWEQAEEGVKAKEGEEVER